MKKAQLIKALEKLGDNADIRISFAGMGSAYSIDAVKTSKDACLECNDILEYEDIQSACKGLLEDNFGLPEEWVDALVTIVELNSPYEEDE
jgi:hypothetical protein